MALRTSIRATLIASILAFYLGIGLCLGAFMSTAIPAMNMRGVLYYAAIWPWFVAAGTFDAPGPPVPHWCFTFE